jgi:DNA-binding NarL/FixJ family response regulator
MSGRKLSDEALRRRPDLKVLYTTGYTQNAIVHNGVLDADARLLLKPYSLDDLAHKVRSVLDEK